MDAAGLDRAVLVGCSRAGSIVHRHRARVSGSGLGPRLGLRRDQRLRGREHARRAGRVRARARPSRRPKDWAAAADHDVAIWVDGFGQPAGRAPAAARDAIRTMAYETYVQEKPYGDTIVLDPPAIGRLGELRLPVLVITGGLDESSTWAGADVLVAAVPGARRIDLPDVAHMPSLERPGVVHRDPARVPRGGRRVPLARSTTSTGAGMLVISARHVAPPGHALDDDPDQRTAVEVVTAGTADTSPGAPRPPPVLGARVGREEVGVAVDPDPGQAAPVLVPALDEQRDRRPLERCRGRERGRARIGGPASACRRGASRSALRRRRSDRSRRSTPGPGADVRRGAIVARVARRAAATNASRRAAQVGPSSRP